MQASMGLPEDVSRAFDAAVLANDPDLARDYLAKGANTLATLQRCIRDQNWPAMEWVIQHELVKGPDVLAVLHNARHVGDLDAIAKLKHPRNVLPTLATMKAQPTEVKLDALKQFVAAGSTPESLLIEAARRYAATDAASAEHDKEILHLLASRGAPALAALIEQSEKGHRLAVQAIIDAGTDDAMAALNFQREMGNREAAELIQYAMLQQMLQANLPEQDKVNLLKMFVDAGWTTSKSLLRDKIMNGEFDAARLLISAGVSTTYLLGQLVAEDRGDLAASVIRLGGDAAAAIAALREEGERLEGEGRQETAEAFWSVADALERMVAT